METHGKGLLGKVILAAVLLIFGAVVVGIVADASYPNTIKTPVSKEAHALKNPAVTGINTTAVYTVTNSNTYGGDCPLTSFSITNQSGSALTLTDDYTVDLNAGTYQLKNTTATLGLVGAYNNSYASYSYCGTGYVNSTWGNSILNMVGGFMALLLFAAAVGVMYSIYKDVTD